VKQTGGANHYAIVQEKMKSNRTKKGGIVIYIVKLLSNVFCHLSTSSMAEMSDGEPMERGKGEMLGGDEVKHSQLTNIQ
jgi:hypothetical protein